MSVPLIPLFLLFVAAAGMPPPKCPQGTVPPPHQTVQNVCFQFVNESLSFRDAELDCRGKDGDLVVINNAFMDTYLVSYARQFFGSAASFWSGARVFRYSGVDLWLWSKYNAIVEYSSFKDAADWTAPKPDNCAAVSLGDTLWTSAPCLEKRPYICELPGAVPVCENGYTLFAETNMCYKLVSDRVNMHTFDQAENNCSSEGGHLASIHSPAENAFVSSLAPGQSFGMGNYTMDLWIGLSSDSHLVHTWTDGTPFDYSNWFANITFGNTCTCLLSDGRTDGSGRMQWEDGYFCPDAVGRFICKKQPALVPLYTGLLE